MLCTTLKFPSWPSFKTSLNDSGRARTTQGNSRDCEHGDNFHGTTQKLLDTGGGEIQRGETTLQPHDPRRNGSKNPFGEGEKDVRRREVGSSRLAASLDRWAPSETLRRPHKTVGALSRT